MFDGFIQTVRHAELRRIVNFWRLREHVEGGLRVVFYRRRDGHVVVCRITQAFDFGG